MVRKRKGLTRRLLGGVGLLSGAVGLAGPAAGQQAYFSLTGDLSAADAEQVFAVEFLRNTTSVDNPQFRTFHQAGGTNAAGQVLAAGSFDPLLNLDDVLGGVVNVTNDDGGTGLDAFLAYSGNGNTGPNLDGLTLNGLHSLSLRKFTAGSTGPWALDVIGPVDAVRLWTPTASANSTMTDVVFGSNGAEGTTPAVLDLNSASLPSTISGALVVAKTGKGLLQKTTSGGDVTVLGLTTIGAGGDAVIDFGSFDADGGITLETLSLTPFDGAAFAINNNASVRSGAALRVESGAVFDLNGGTLIADGDIEVDGGTFTALIDGVTQAAGTSIVVSNNGQFNHDPAYRINFGQSIVVESGGDAAFKGSFGLATNGDGTIRATGSGSTFSIDSAFNTFWGTGANNAVVEVLDGGSATIDFAGGIDFARSTNTSNSSAITVETGGTLTFANTRLTLAEDNSGSAVDVTVDGAGSTLTLTGNKELIIGGTGAGSASVTVRDNGALVTSTGLTTIAQTGSVAVNTGGSFSVLGDLRITEGSVTSDAASSFLAAGNIDVVGGTLAVAALPTQFLGPGKTLTALSGAQVTTAGSGANALVIDDGQSVMVADGSDYTHTGQVTVGLLGGAGTLDAGDSGTKLTVTDALTVAQGASTGIVNITGDARATVSGPLNMANSATTSDTHARLNINSLGRLTLNNNLLIGQNDGDQGIAVVEVSGANSFLTQTGANVLTLGNADTPENGGSHVVNVINDGNVFLGSGTHTINQTGVVNINGSGYLSSSGDINVIGGRINTTGAGGAGFNGLTLLSSATLTASDEAVLNFQGGYQLNNDATVQITDGADWTVLDTLDIGLTSDATVVVDGVGSTLFANTSQSLPQSIRLGLLNAVGTLTVRNGAIAGANGSTLGMADLGIVGSAGHVNVESGGQFNTRDIRMATNDEGTASLTVTGTNSLLSQTGSTDFVVGSAGNSSATVTIADNATLITGTGTLTVNPKGAIVVDSGGKFNVNGPINDINGGSVDFNGTGSRFNLTVGGTVNITNGGQFRFNSTAFNDRYFVRDGRTFNVLTGGTLHHAGGLQIGSSNTGTVVIDGENSELSVGTRGLGVGSLGGNGQLTIRNQATATINSSLTIGEGGSVGRVDIESGSIVNTSSAVSLSNLGTTGNTATLNVTGAGTILNMPADGVLRLGHSGGGNSATATLASSATMNTSAIVVNTDGVFDLLNGNLNTGLVQLNGTGQFNFLSGRLSTDFFLGDFVHQGGVLMAGAETGGVRAQNNYAMIGGAVEIGIGGPLPFDDYNRLEVADTATLTGTLKLMLTDGFTPTLGESFTVVTSDTRVGTFNTITGVTFAPGLGLAVTYAGDDVLVTAALSGDTDLDGDIDDADLGTSFANYTGPLVAGAGGKTWIDGDTDGDGDVDDADLGSSFAGYTGPLTPSSVPEPAALAMLLPAVILLGRRR